MLSTRDGFYLFTISIIVFVAAVSNNEKVSKQKERDVVEVKTALDAELAKLSPEAHALYEELLRAVPLDTTALQEPDDEEDIETSAENCPIDIAWRESPFHLSHNAEVMTPEGLSVIELMLTGDVGWRYSALEDHFADSARKM